MCLPRKGRLEDGCADTEAAAASPLGGGAVFAVLVAPLTRPKPVKGDPGWAAGCEAAGCAADLTPPRTVVGGLLAGLVLGRALAKSDPPVGLEDDATAGCEEAGCAAGLLAGVAPERALAKSDPPTVDGCEEAGCAAGVLAGVVLERGLPKNDSPAVLKEDTADGCEEAGCAAGVCPPRPKVGCLLADVVVGRAFAENSPPIAGLEESAAVLEGSPNLDDGPGPKRLRFGTAVEAVVVGVALANGEASDAFAFQAFL